MSKVVNNTIHDKVCEMFVMQEMANNLISGSEWKNGKNEDGQEIDWNRASMMELSELVDSFQYKWWKANKVNELYSCLDEDNVKIELVDIWHFLMSELIRLFEGTPHYPTLLEEIADNINDKVDKSINYSGREFLNEVTVALNLITSHMIIVENIPEELSKSNYGDIKDFLWTFLNLVNQVMTFDEFYEKYTLKNVLNIFRLKHGYREGTYKKEWMGREDNKYLEDYLEGGNEVSYYQIYEYLEGIYEEVNK